MTAMGKCSMYTMSHRASAGSMDASASYARCASFRAVAMILDAMILASIFVVAATVIFLVSLNGLSNSLVLAVLVQVVLLAACHRMKPKR